MKPNEPCVCGSGRPFGKCCEPLLAFRQVPRTPKQLVRARYAAYALGAHKEFLIKTWHPVTARTVSIADLDTPRLEWKGLEIISAEQKGDYARVEFRATYSEDGGEDRVHHEAAVFNRHKGVWMYVEGGVVNEEESGTSPSG